MSCAEDASLIASLINRIAKSASIDDKFVALLFVPASIGLKAVDLSDPSIQWVENSYPEKFPQKYVMSKFTIGSQNPASAILQAVAKEHSTK